jgi:beta-xylosidase
MKKHLQLICFILLLLNVLATKLSAQKYQSDNGDGTYTNPLIYADFPDPDVIRVDSVYYMVSTTMFIFPGVNLLKSYDLVNWEYCSNAVERMDFSPCYNLDGCNRYAHGQWATSLKYHNGIYYLLFITLDEGGFICRAENPEGPWEIEHLPRGFYDPGLFFDDNGKIYVAHGYSTINITELDSNFTAIDKDSLVFTGDIRPGLEGSHVYKINGYYYLYATYGGGDGFQVALRSRNIYGPYEEKIVIQDNGNLGTGIHQGAIIQTQTGEWWSVIFQDGGAFGRFPTLQPITWEDNWPMVGVNGKGVITYPKPNVGREYPITQLPTSDEFEGTELGMQWGWNHNPDPSMWSLTANPGFLRLSTAKVVTNLREARNTLTQRIFAYYSRSIVTNGSVKVDISNMQNGDVAGLAVFQDPYAFIGVKRINNTNYILMVNNGVTKDSVITEAPVLYLRAHANYATSQASFDYSTDNISFIPLGNDLSMQFNLSIFTGNKFCLFNYATQSTGGHVDFDWFRTEACMQTYVSAHLQLNDEAIMDTNRITINPGDSVTLMPEAEGDGTWKWSGCGINSSENLNSLTLHPVSNCLAVANFTNACGYKSMAVFYIYINSTTDIQNTETGSVLKLSPNPSGSELHVYWTPKYTQLSIFDLKGTELIRNNYSQPQYSADLPLCLASGMYIVKVKNSNDNCIEKLLIE